MSCLWNKEGKIKLIIGSTLYEGAHDNDLHSERMVQVALCDKTLDSAYHCLRAERVCVREGVYGIKFTSMNHLPRASLTFEVSPIL